ncbi:24-hydroxycholesterol 7-alpha-hydroxylase-like isoform X2 [Dysidea avara]
MTFVTSPTHHNYFFHTTHADFQQAVQPFTERAAGVSKSSFFTYHSSMHDLIKGSFVPASLSTICDLLSSKLHYGISKMEDREMDLMMLVKSIMFPATVARLFGDDVMPEGKDKVLEFQEHFFKYDQDFEYGAELPSVLLREWSTHKKWLQKLFQQFLMKRDGAEMSDSSQSVFNKILATVDKENAPNYGVLLLWASQANATPMVFWTLCFILSDPVIHQAVTQEVTSILPPLDELGHTPITYEMIQQLLTVKRCVLEAIRLRPPGMITRKVTETHTLGDYTIPQGHYLMLSPFWEHRNPDLFPSPDKFDPDRWRSCDLNKNQFLEGFVGFGGGRYQCPGRWFALMEMHLVVAMVIHMMDFQMLDQVPDPSPLHLVGSPQPQQPCRVAVQLKNKY